MKYRYIFVDLDNTLLDFEAAEEYSFYYTAQSRGLSFGEAELDRYQAINAPLWKMMERREITKDALVVRRFRELFEELLTVPFRFAPAQMNRQRGACVAALGMLVMTETAGGYDGAYVVSSDEFTPDYLRKPQAEREREARISPEGAAARLAGDR